jgi:hypothetical protein
MPTQVLVQARNLLGRYLGSGDVSALTGPYIFFTKITDPRKRGSATQTIRPPKR